MKSLDYNRRIIEAGISPLRKDGVWNTYILGNREHPDAVKVNKNTYDIVEIPDAEAVALMDQIEAEEAEKRRIEAAKEALKTVQAEETEGVDLGIDEEAVDNTGLVVDPETGDLVIPFELEQREEKRRKERGETPDDQQDTSSEENNRNRAKPQVVGDSSTTQSFDTLVRSKQWRMQVLSTIKTKWPDAPTKVSDMTDFLKKKNVETDAIGTSESAIKAWIDTIINCR